MRTQSSGAFARRPVAAVLLAVCFLALRPPDALAYDFIRLYAVPSNDEKPKAETFNLPTTDRIVLGTARYVHVVIEFKASSRSIKRVAITCTRYLPDGNPAMRIVEVRDPRIGRTRTQIRDQVRHEVDLAPAGGTTSRLAGFGPFDPGYPQGTYAIECVADGAKVRGTFRLEAMTMEELIAMGRKAVGQIGFHGPRLLNTTIPEGDKCRVKPTGGMGSGFLIDNLGHMVTNHHVVAVCRNTWRENRLYVEFPDGGRYDAELVGDDEHTDIAVIRLAIRSLPFLQWAASLPKDGADALALGYPQPGFTATRGIVSATARAVSHHADLVQTDAAINPGNSGGPLLDRFGQVIGVNTASTPDSPGLNFAVSAATARTVAQQIVEHGRVRRARLGVNETFRTVPFDIRAFSSGGLVVQTVAPGSPAAVSGIRVCDVIESIDWEPVSGGDRLAGRPEKQSVAIDSQGALFATLLRIPANTDVAVKLRRPRSQDCESADIPVDGTIVRMNAIRNLERATPMTLTIRVTGP